MPPANPGTVQKTLIKLTKKDVKSITEMLQRDDKCPMHEKSDSLKAVDHVQEQGTETSDDGSQQSMIWISMYVFGGVLLLVGVIFVVKQTTKRRSIDQNYRALADQVQAPVNTGNSKAPEHIRRNTWAVGTLSA